MAMNPPSDRGAGDKYGDQSHKFPPEPSKHEIDDDRARRMRKAYLERYAGKPDELRPGAYARDIFDQILAQPNCVGIRFYPGIDDKGHITMMFCGVDSRGDDILAGVVGDVPWRCPPYCSSSNGVLHF